MQTLCVQVVAGINALLWSKAQLVLCRTPSPDRFSSGLAPRSTGLVIGLGQQTMHVHTLILSWQSCQASCRACPDGPSERKRNSHAALSGLILANQLDVAACYSNVRLGMLPALTR